MSTTSSAIRWRLILSVLLIASWSATASAQVGSSFAKVVEAQFTNWDLDHDGSLEASEVDQLMNRPEIKGEAAAALAAIKRHERVATYAERTRYAASRDELTRSVGEPEPIDPQDPTQAGMRIIPYEAVFRHYARMLATINRKLYAGDGPSFQAMKQGPIGDCYFFSITGYLAAREPKKIQQMIFPEPEGSFLVRFFDGERVRITAPTDAEILLNNSASSLADGLWLPVLEKALGEKLRLNTPRSRRTGEATDAMAAGGTVGQIIRLYSGHRDTEIRLRESRYVGPRLDLLRRLLPQVLDRGMLVGAEMAKNPPRGHAKILGLGYGHAYAILGFDPETDRIKLWNPWGQTFTPAGPEGSHHGFATDHGVFQMPLRTFYEHFSGVNLETLSRAAPDTPVRDFYLP